MTDKRYLSANELLEDAYALGVSIIDDSFVPDLIIGIARGGEPIAIAIHELYCFAGATPSYRVIRASSYSGIDQQDEVRFSIPEELSALFGDCPSVLLVDDVFDTGKTLSAITRSIGNQHPGIDLRSAAVWYKPARNETALVPDYFLHETSDWLVFPHELCGLERDEISSGKPGLSRDILQSICAKKT